MAHETDAIDPGDRMHIVFYSKDQGEHPFRSELKSYGKGQKGVWFLTRTGGIIKFPFIQLHFNPVSEDRLEEIREILSAEEAAAR